jgi:uncharacterized repeat protein (TIGR01451 family)
MLGLNQRTSQRERRWMLATLLAVMCALAGACADGEESSTGDDEIELAEAEAALIVNGEKSVGHPAAAQLGDRRFIAWGGTDAAKRLNLTSSLRGGAWGNKITLEERTNGNGGAALAVFNDRLYLGWTGTDDRLNIMSSADGVTWGGKRTFEEWSHDSPALTVHEGRLYVAFTGTDDYLRTFWTGDGSSFTAPVRIDERSHNAPSITSFEEHLILGWTGIHQHLNIGELDDAGNRLRRANCDEKSWDGTFIMGFGHTLIVSWRGNFLNEQLNHVPMSWAFLDAWLDNGGWGGLPNKVTMNDKSNRMPTWANFAGSAALVWRGTDSQVNVLEGLYELPKADLSVAITPSQSSVEVTQSVVLDVFVRNAGPNAAEASSVALTIPGGLTYASCSSTNGFSCVQAGSFLLLNLAGLGVHGVASARVELKAACTFKTQVLGLWATVSSATLDPNAANNAASATVTVNPWGPILTVPPAATALTCSLEGTSLDLGAPVVYDVCDRNPTVRVRIVSMAGQPVDIPVTDDTVFPLCESVVEYTAVNAGGFVETATQLVNVGFQHDACANGACCPAGSSLVDLDERGDTYSGRTAGECVLGTAGNDIVALSGGASALFGGPGHDTIAVGGGAYTIRAGQGNDIVSAFGGGVSLWGNEGDDVLFVGHGDNEVYPGPGLDTVSLGAGDNTVLILDLCEVEPGETLEGGPGHDTLIAPVGAEELAEAGLALEGFDEIVVDASRGCASECRLVSESCSP